MRAPFRFRRSLVATMAAVAVVTAGCGGDGEGTSPDAADGATEESADN